VGGKGQGQRGGRGGGECRIIVRERHMIVLSVRPKTSTRSNLVFVRGEGQKRQSKVGGGGGGGIRLEHIDPQSRIERGDAIQDDKRNVERLRIDF
jgi:hypothetical protein